MSTKVVIHPLSGDEDVLEAKVKQWLRQQIKKRYPDAWKYWAPGGRYSRKAVPDLIMSIDGLFISIEVKRVSGRPTQMQIIELDKIAKSGALAILLHGRNERVFKLIDYWRRTNERD
jgi:hypothetical protein